MRKFATTLLLCLLIAWQSYSQNVFPRVLTDSTWEVTTAQLLNATLTGDSLDDFKERADSLQAQVDNAAQVIKSDSLVKENLISQIANYESTDRLQEIELWDEKHISSSLRNKYRLWKLAAIILAGVNVYQVVK